MAAAQQRALEVSVARERQEEASLVRGAIEAQREVKAALKKEELLAEAAAKASKVGLKVEAANEKKAAEAEAKAKALDEKMAAAEARKAGVRYPPSCRTIPKSVSFAPSATGIIGRRGRFTAVKAVFAGLLGGAVFRGLSYLGASIFTKALKGVATTKLIK